jgi:hypothetical protein
VTYENTIAIWGDGQSGKQGFLTVNQIINFSNLFDGEPQFFAGSQIQVQEILTLYFNVVDSKKIGVDFNWFQSKEYLGNYQFSDSLDTAIVSGDEGFITNRIQKIKRYSTYTVTANPDIPFARGTRGYIGQCNFELEEIEIQIPGLGALGVSRPRDINDGILFLTSDALTKVGLADRQYFPKILQVGLFVSPGAEIYLAEYKIDIINGIYIAEPEFPIPTCSLASPGGACQADFTTFVEDGFPFITLNRPEGIEGEDYTSEVWVCPSDPTVTFNYFQFFSD